MTLTTEEERSKKIKVLIFVYYFWNWEKRRREKNSHPSSSFYFIFYCSHLSIFKSQHWIFWTIHTFLLNIYTTHRHTHKRILYLYFALPIKHVLKYVFFVCCCFSFFVFYCCENFEDFRLLLIRILRDRDFHLIWFHIWLRSLNKWWNLLVSSSLSPSLVLFRFSCFVYFYSLFIIVYFNTS